MWQPSKSSKRRAIELPASFEVATRLGQQLKIEEQEHPPPHLVLRPVMIRLNNVYLFHCEVMARLFSPAHMFILKSHSRR